MSKKLYIGGLSYSTTDAALLEAFSKAGTVVSSAVIIDRMTGQSKGFGFIEMATEKEAEDAIAMYNGQEFDGKTLTVNEARSNEDRPNRSHQPHQSHRQSGNWRR
jgi:RNA recognition motif-containing protein